MMRRATGNTAGTLQGGLPEQARAAHIISFDSGRRRPRGRALVHGVLGRALLRGVRAAAQARRQAGHAAPCAALAVRLDRLRGRTAAGRCVGAGRGRAAQARVAAPCTTPGRVNVCSQGACRRRRRVPAAAPVPRPAASGSAGAGAPARDGAQHPRHCGRTSVGMRARTLSSTMSRVASAATACAAASAATRSGAARCAATPASASAYSSGGRPGPHTPTSHSARARSSAPITPLGPFAAPAGSCARAAVARRLRWQAALPCSQPGGPRASGGPGSRATPRRARC